MARGESDTESIEAFKASHAAFSPSAAITCYNTHTHTVCIASLTHPAGETRTFHWDFFLWIICEGLCVKFGTLTNEAFVHIRLKVILL